MKSAKMLTILVLALGLMVCLPELAKAAPMGTAFTYQGRLLDADRPADGIYDAIFVLLDSPVGPNELGVIIREDFEALDGYFTVELDFGGNAFDGSERWLEVYVRPGDFNDPCGYTILWPRQKVTVAPYALYAASGGADSDWTISGNNMHSAVSGNVGIGTPSPNGKLHARGDSTDGVIGWTGASDKSGVFGNSEVGTGVTGRSEAASGWGVAGIVTAANSRAVYGNATGPNSVGVYGRSNLGDGVVGKTSANDKSAVFGSSNNGVGVKGRSDKESGVVGWTGDPNRSGVFGNSDKGTGVTGRSEAASGYGVAGMAEGANGRGIYGNATASNGVGVYGRSDQGIGVEGRSPNADGVVGWTAASGKSGVFGHSEVGIGVAGRSAGDAGVRAVTTSTNPSQAALVARNEGSGPAIYAESGTNGLAAVFNGTTKTNVLEITGGSDLSEQFQINAPDEKLSSSPGMVVSIDPENPGDLIMSNKAYDPRVAGIISGAGDVKPGMLMGQKGTKADGKHPVALVGRVYCWVDASYGKIQPGDLLTTSNTPGHAMKVRDFTKVQGAVLGKAMSALEEGRGLVLVLVTLQ